MIIPPAKYGGKPEPWMIPCRYCRRNPCIDEQYAEEVIPRSCEVLSDERKELFKRMIYPAGLRFGMNLNVGSPCAALNLWLLKSRVDI